MMRKNATVLAEINQDGIEFLNYIEITAISHNDGLLLIEAMKISLNNIVEIPLFSVSVPEYFLIIDSKVCFICILLLLGY